MIEYVFGEVVVVKTGRIACKQTSSDIKTKRRPKHDEKEPVMYEIEPAYGDIKWKKWVKDEDLYVIQQTPSVVEIDNDIPDNITSADEYLNEVFSKNFNQHSETSQEE